MRCGIDGTVSIVDETAVAIRAADAFVSGSLSGAMDIFSRSFCYLIFLYHFYSV